MGNEHLLAVIREHTTPAEYEALILWADGHSHTEACEFLGISRRAYRERINRGLERINRVNKP